MRRMRSFLGPLRRSLQQWRSECLFTTMPVPGVVNPLIGVNNALDSVRGLRLTSPIVKKSAITACQQARQACKHVDIATGNNVTTSWPTMRMPQQTYALPYPPPGPSNVIDVMSLDKDQLMALSKGILASQQTQDAAQIATNIDAVAASARAIRAAEGVTP
jgi:hypothetical protein